MKPVGTAYRMQFRTIRRQRGASLLEGIAYLAIASTVILGAVSLLTGAFGNAQANRANEEIISLRTAARKMYSGQTYPAVMDALITANAVPATLKVDASAKTITNAWGGAVSVDGVAGGGTFTISYSDVPQDVCINLVSGASGWVKIAGGGSTEVTTFPATADSAVAACATTNTLVFTAA